MTCLCPTRYPRIRNLYPLSRFPLNLWLLLDYNSLYYFVFQRPPRNECKEQCNFHLCQDESSVAGLLTFEWWLFTAFCLFNESMQKRINLRETGPTLKNCIYGIRSKVVTVTARRRTFPKLWHAKATLLARGPKISF